MGFKISFAFPVIFFFINLFPSRFVASARNPISIETSEIPVDFTVG